MKLWHGQIIWYLFEGFKAIILCSVDSSWFVKYVFPAKIEFVKTSTRIVRYASRVVKSNPVSFLTYGVSLSFFYMHVYSNNLEIYQPCCKCLVLKLCLNQQHHVRPNTQKPTSLIQKKSQFPQQMHSMQEYKMPYVIHFCNDFEDLYKI